MRMLVLLPFLLICTALHAQQYDVSQTTPSAVYSQLLQLQKEIALVKKHAGIKEKVLPTDVNTPLLPRHAWQRTYELFVKLNILRRENGLPIIEPVNMEPTINLDPAFTFEQTQRLLQEIEILKFRLGIQEKASQVQSVTGKTPTDVYNLLGITSREFDLINGKTFTPSYVFAECMRIEEDMQAILNHLGIYDTTTPPRKQHNATPKDSYEKAIELLNTIKNLEAQAGLKTVDFYAFRRSSVTPSDVFEITQIILAELQVIKAYIGLNYTITRGAEHYEDKTPADVDQLLGWLLRQSALIHSLKALKAQ